MSIFKDFIASITTSAIYDIGKAAIQGLGKTEWAQTILKKIGADPQLHDFRERYIEALVDLKFEKKDIVILQFFREESIMQLFYDYYYGVEDKKYNDDIFYQGMYHCVEFLKVGEDVVNANVNVKVEIIYFWKTFQQKVHETRSLKEAEAQIQLIFIKETIAELYKSATPSLCIIVLCENIGSILNKFDFDSLHAYYGKKHEEWRPFKVNSISELIQEYSQSTGFPIDLIFWQPELNNDDSVIEFIDEFAENSIVITDGLLLSDSNKFFVDKIDHKKDIGGLAILIDDQFDFQTKDLLIKKHKTNFPTMWTRCERNWHISTENIELTINDKKIMFRRLTNFAKRIGIVYKNTKKFTDKYPGESLNKIKNPNG